MLGTKRIVQKVVGVAVIASVGAMLLPTVAQAAPKRKLTIADAAVIEGDAGAVALTFRVVYTGKPTNGITVDYATAAGTAAADVDYTSASGTAVLPNGGCKCADVVVDVLGDLEEEATETLTVSLSNPAIATIADGSATGTILDDDGPPAIVVLDVVRRRVGRQRLVRRDAHVLRPRHGDGRLRDGRRHGPGRQRLHRDERHRDVRAGRHRRDRRGPGARRRRRRGGAVVHARPLEPRGGHDQPVPGVRHDRRHRRRSRALGERRVRRRGRRRFVQRHRHGVALGAEREDGRGRLRDERRRCDRRHRLHVGDRHPHVLPGRHRGADRHRRARRHRGRGRRGRRRGPVR